MERGEHQNMIYEGYPVYIATKTWPKRKHRKKRINKKWLKRYGCYEMNMMPHNQVMLFDGVIWMTRRTWEQLAQKGKRKNGKKI